MSKEVLDTVKASNEVDSIRKILFGDQVAQIEERFSAIEKSIAQLRSENRNLRQALEAELTMREQATAELDRMVHAALKERDQARSAHLATQTDLLNSLLSAIDQYKSKIGTPDS